MAKNKITEPQNGVLTIPMNVDTKEFKEFKRLLTKKVNSLTEEEKLEIELFARKIKEDK